MITVNAAAPQGDANQSGAGPGRETGAKFPHNLRLLRHADFERVYQQGRRHFSPHMTVFYLRREQGEGLRIGFTVGRILGGAVERNRIKRRLREAVRLQRPKAIGPVDVVVNPKKSVLRVEFGELMREVARAFEVIQQKLAEKPRGQQ